MAKKITKEELNQTEVVENNQWVQIYGKKKYFNNIKGWIQRSHILYGDNREAFKKLFGTCHGTMHGEYYKRIWRVEFEGASFYLFTGKGFGSAYEVHNTDSLFYVDNEAGQKCIRFMDWIYKKLCEVKK